MGIYRILQDDELMHYGVKGMKWGKRNARSQHPTLEAGINKKRQRWNRVDYYNNKERLAKTARDRAYLEENNRKNKGALKSLKEREISQNIRKKNWAGNPIDNSPVAKAGRLIKKKELENQIKRNEKSIKKIKKAQTILGNKKYKKKNRGSVKRQTK